MNTAIEYWDAQPCNSRHSPLSPGTLGYWDEVRRRRYHVESHIPEHAGFRDWQDARVLDMGCGIGTDAVSFALCGARVTALDASERSLQMAQMQAAQYRVSYDLGYFSSGGRVRFVQTDLEEPVLLFQQTFDLVWSHGVLHHLEDPFTALRSAFHLLKPGGELRCMVYHRWSSKWAACKLGLMQPEAQRGVPIVRAYSRRGGRCLLESAGFEVTDVRSDTCSPIGGVPTERGCIACPTSRSSSLSSDW